MCGFGGMGVFVVAFVSLGWFELNVIVFVFVVVCLCWCFRWFLCWVCFFLRVSVFLCEIICLCCLLI